MSAFMDGNRITPGTERCVCGNDCEFPCWQRLGLTEQPCCAGCPSEPLMASMMEERVASEEEGQR